ncbi:MAG: hydrogenase [Epsilonproteobacteria bacterium]|nr:hydrogenase [Campylobacterota bacterium]
MAIKQRIHFDSNPEYFMGFLQSSIDEAGIIGSVVYKDRAIEMLLDDADSQKLEKFSELSEKRIAHSLFLGEIQTAHSNEQITPSHVTSKDYAIAPCPQCLLALTNPASEHYLDASLRCSHYNNPASESLQESVSFSPHYNGGDTLLLCDATRIGELFYITQDEVSALLSIEKPTLRVTIQDEELKALTGKNYIKVRAPFSMASALVALNAKESGLPYLFFYDQMPLNAVVAKQNRIIIQDKRALLTPLESFSSQPLINRVLNIAKEAGFAQSLVAYMNSGGIAFYKHDRGNVQKMLSFGAFNQSKVMSELQSNPLKARMLQNFETQHPEIFEKIGIKEDRTLYEFLALLLGLSDESYEALSEKSLEFHGSGGVKIDTFFNDGGLDYTAFMGSVMSFILAGTSSAYLAYSVYEALADSAISTLTQLKSRTHLKHFIMLGDMFENSVLYSRILSKFALEHPFFSKRFALDD